MKSKAYLTGLSLASALPGDLEARQLDTALRLLLAFPPADEIENLTVIEQRDIKVHRLFSVVALGRRR